MASCLEWAKYYSQIHWSPIPVSEDKKTLVKWRPYQEQAASIETIEEWWTKWPNAGIAIVTGRVSNLVVIDCDTPDGHREVEGMLPDGLITPMVRTQSGGWHYYFQYPGYRVSNSAGVIPGVDVRGDGGMAMAPPTQGTKGKYKWEKGLMIGKVPVAALPSNLISSLNIKSNDRASSFNSDPNCPHLSSFDIISFDKGRRDEALFHVANSLVKGGMAPQNIEKVLINLASTCNPPFEQTEIKAKIDSAIERANRRERNLTQEIREWCLSSNGIFLSSDVLKELDLSSRALMKQGYNALSRLCEEGIIERTGDRRGVFRVVDKESAIMDWQNAPTGTFDVAWPFGIENYCEIYPGSVVVVAGEANSGKTAFLLNVAKMNMHKHDVQYFNSEMGDTELRKRLMLFRDAATTDWSNFTPRERNSNFADVIRPNSINIIDFLEINDEHWKVGVRIKEIYNKLDKGIAVIGLQKPPGRDVGTGGVSSLEKPRLYLAMEPGKCKIIKAKSWTTNKNPNGLIQRFTLYQGCEFHPKNGWVSEDEDDYDQGEMSSWSNRPKRRMF